MKTQLVVIGGGPGGYAAAFLAADVAGRVFFRGWVCLSSRYGADGCGILFVSPPLSTRVRNVYARVSLLRPDCCRWGRQVVRARGGFQLLLSRLK